MADRTDHPGEEDCLSGDTLIAMASGPAKPLCEVRAGDRVLAGNYEATRVMRVSRGVCSGKHTRYIFSDGTVIDETRPHRFFNLDQGFWQLLERWKPGEHARKRDGTTPALVSREDREERAEIFGLRTEARTYWANGLLSGEAAANEMLLGDATKEQAAAMAASFMEQDVLRALEKEEES